MATSAYAEYTACPADKAIKIPSSIPEKHAAAAILQGLTALTLVSEAHKVEKGDWVLVHAAAGGVGLWLCQILRAIGARTIGTASTAEKIQLAKDNGAEYMIDYSKDSVPEKVKEITDGEGVRVVFDGVGKSTFDGSMEAVARKGSMISFGNASGAVPPVTIAYVRPFSFPRPPKHSPSSSLRAFILLPPSTPLSNTLHTFLTTNPPPHQPPLRQKRQTPPPNALQLHLHARRTRAIRRRAIRDDEQGQDERPDP